MFDEVKDSGKRQEFNTGSVRDTSEGKGRFDLIPSYALTRLAQHYENGAKKYEDRNWEKGQPLSRYLDSMIRHAYKFLGGSRDEDHLAAVAWNALALIETEYRINKGILPKELDDIEEVRKNLVGDIADKKDEAIEEGISDLGPAVELVMDWAKLKSDCNRFQEAMRNRDRPLVFGNDDVGNKEGRRMPDKIWEITLNDKEEKVHINKCWKCRGEGYSELSFPYPWFPPSRVVCPLCNGRKYLVYGDEDVGYTRITPDDFNKEQGGVR